MYVIFSREIALLIFKNLHHKILKLNKKNTISKNMIEVYQILNFSMILIFITIV